MEFGGYCPLHPVHGLPKPAELLYVLEKCLCKNSTTSAIVLQNGPGFDTFICCLVNNLWYTRQQRSMRETGAGLRKYNAPINVTAVKVHRGCLRHVAGWTWGGAGPFERQMVGLWCDVVVFQRSDIWTGSIPWTPVNLLCPSACCLGRSAGWASTYDTTAQPRRGL